MHLLTKEQCKAGMKVELVAPDVHYVIGEANPVKGSIFECTGIITGAVLGNSPITVKWENGVCNGYKKNELLLVSDALEDDPGKYQSIW